MKRTIVGLARRLALRSVPRELHHELGDDFERALDDRMLAARQRGRGALLVAWLRTLADALLMARYRTPHPRLGAPTPRRDAMLKDLTYAARGLRKRPGFTFVAAATLALGIGANTAIFSVVNAVLLTPLDYANSNRLVRVWSSHPSTGERYFTSPAEFLELRQRTRSLDGLAAFLRTESTVVLDNLPVRVAAGIVSHELFDVLGVRPLLGREFTPEDADPATATPKVLISYGIWQSQFGGRADILEQTIDFGASGGGLVPITGVMPAEVDLPADADFWYVLVDLPSDPSVEDHWLDVVGLLRPGVSLDAASLELNGIMAALADERPELFESWGVTLAPLHEVVVGDVRPALLTLLAAAGTILLIACANVANLLLTRSEDRQREVALRAALGAAQSRLAAQMLAESLMLASIGALLGVALAVVGVRALVAAGPEQVPRLASVSVDATVLGFALAITVITGVAFGLVPAVRLRALAPGRVLTSIGKGSAAGGGRERLRSTFVVVQIALSVMLVVGAGLLIRSLSRLASSDPGFDPSALVSAELTLPNGRFTDSDAVADFYTRLMARLEAQSATVAVGAASTLPLRDQWDYPAPIYRADQARPETEDELRPYYRQVTEGFFDAMSMEIVRGRSFTREDDERAAGVVVVNEAMARAFWPGEDALNKRLDGAAYVFGPLGETRLDEVTVVGIVRDVKYRGLRDSAEMSVYFPHRQAPFRRMTVVLRTLGDSATAVTSMREAIAELDPELAVSRVWTLPELVSRSLARDRFSMTLLTLFGAVALVLAAIGIYGVVSFAVAQRTTELGVRVALGASAAGVVWLVFRRVMVLVTFGVGIGLAGSAWLTRLLASQLYGTRPTDPLTLAAVALVLGLTAIVASAMPTLRALRVDPVEALRQQ